MSKLDLIRGSQANGAVESGANCHACPMCDEIRGLRQELVSELREMRTMFQNSVPLPIVMKLIAPIFKALCLTLLMLVIWLTGVKAFLPHVIG